MSTTAANLPERDGTVAQVQDKTRLPEGVISRRAQQYLVLGIAVVIVLVALFSRNRQPRVVAATPSSAMPQVREGNERKLADYREELAAQQRAADSAHALPQLPPPSNPIQGANATTANGKYSGVGQTDERTTNAQERDPIADADRQRSYTSRFASNIAFAAQPVGKTEEKSQAAEWAEMRLPAPAMIERRIEHKPINANVNSATGEPYLLFEGTTVETTLVNRLDGDYSGPVKVMVTNPVYSHDRQHVLIPEGTNILGEVRAVQGFGQRRLAVVFHRMIMPDGYSVDLDQFRGLNQVGETELKDQVNNHYMQVFGTSIALGVIAGAAEGSASNVGIYASGSDAYRQGVASSVSQSSTRILDRFLNINPTLTIREGHRVKVYLTNDLLLPAYENHTVPPNI
jgi:type IV secretion system protein VirB10